MSRSAVRRQARCHRNLPLVWIAQGSTGCSHHSAYLLPTRSKLNDDGIRVVQVHWQVSDYSGWVPASSVALIVDETAGRQSRNKQAAAEVNNDKTRQEKTLQALEQIIAFSSNDNDGSVSSLCKDKHHHSSSSSSLSGPSRNRFTSDYSNPSSSTRLRELSLLSDSLSSEPINDEMGQRPTRKSWTREEETVLRQQRHGRGRTRTWAEVSACLPGRTLEACRLKDRRRLIGASAGKGPRQVVGNNKSKSKAKLKIPVKANAGNVRKNRLFKTRGISSQSSVDDNTSRLGKRWTAEEDRILRHQHKAFGNQWEKIASFLKGRGCLGCRKRIDALAAKASKASLNSRDTSWTQKEDSILREQQALFGNRWECIAAHLPHRSGGACRKRFEKLVEEIKSTSINPGAQQQRASLTGNKNQQQQHGPRFTAENVRLVRAHVLRRYVI